MVKKQLTVVMNTRSNGIGQWLKTNVCFLVSVDLKIVLLILETQAETHTWMTRVVPSTAINIKR